MVERHGGAGRPGLDQHSVDADAVTKRPASLANGPDVRFVSVGAGFFRTYGVRLVTGRLLDRDQGGDDTPQMRPDPTGSGPHVGSLNVVLNAKAVQTLGFSSAASAIGKPLLIDDSDVAASRQRPSSA